MSKMSTSSDVLGKEPWQLLESAPDAQHAALHETLFALGNGRIGVRGAHAEGARWPGTVQDAIFINFINGFYDTEDIHDAENAYGLARPEPVHRRRAQRHGDPLVDRRRSVRSGARPHRGLRARRFDFKSGRPTRELVWVSPLGRRAAVRGDRMVCFVREHVYAIEFEPRALDRAARIVVESLLDARSQRGSASEDPRAGSAHATQALEWVDRSRRRSLRTPISRLVRNFARTVQRANSNDAAQVANASSFGINNRKNAMSFGVQVESW
jgi:alpha,alpha-trehalose phosphorylase